MVQIKDSVLRVSGIPSGFSPHRPGVRIVVMPHRRICAAWPSGIRCGKDVRTAFLTQDDAGGCQQLVNNLSRVLYVVDFRRVVRASKKVRIFRKIGLTFQKVVHGFSEHRNDTACKLKTRRKKCAAAFPRKPFRARDLRTAVPFDPDSLPTAFRKGRRGIVNKF